MRLAPKLSQKEESAICLDCGECCKRYWITLLPQEVSKISKDLNKSKSDFLENDCILHVKLFPKSTPGVLTFPSTFFPERIYKLIKKETHDVPQSFFVVPQVVLKREEKIVFDFKEKKSRKEKRNACIFIDVANKCEIYSSRPSPCRLFPFIAMEGFREQYPFCELYQKTFKDLAIESKIYYKKVQEYFGEVDKKGFVSVWRNPPKQGILFLQDTQLEKISLDELIQIMPKKS